MALRDVIGHKKPIAVLMHAIKADRAASAYLFAGDSGIGKKFAAVNFAKALNCAKMGYEENYDSCDECLSCRKIASGVHPDVMIIKPEKSVIKVDEIRQVEEALSFKPHEGSTKVVIMDDAEAMNLSSANAFLKTLEEPPSHSLIILVSAQPDLLPETIRSRCIRINFKPLSPEDCEAVLRRAVPSLQKDAVLSKTLVWLSMGRPGAAIEEDLINDRDSFLRLLREIAVSGGKTPWKDRSDMEAWLDMALCLLRDMAVFKITGNTEGLINKDIEDVITKMCGRADLKVIIECCGELLRIRNHLRFNLNKAVTWNYIGSVLRGANVI